MSITLTPVIPNPNSHGVRNLWLKWRYGQGFRRIDKLVND